MNSTRLAATTESKTSRPANLLSALKRRIDYGLLTALAIPLLAILPLLTHAGLPNTADGPVHLMRQVELNEAWAEGNYYPRWGTDLALGHGMPIFSYAPPFLYHLTQLFHLTGLPLDESMKGVIIFDFLLYSVGMFLFARRIYGPAPALFAAAVYVYAPYRLREAYIQGNYGQFSGLAFYPLIFWAFHALITDGRPRYLVAAALSLAGLLFSHNISFMLFAPIFAAYLVFLLSLRMAANRSEWPRIAANGESQYGIRNTQHASPSLLPPLLHTIAAGLLGLGLAAVFWLPAFGERHDIKLEGITQGFFNFRENFISLPELLSPPKPLDLAAINPEFPLSLGLPQLIGALLGFVALVVFGRMAAKRGEWPRSVANGETQYAIRNTQYATRTTYHAPRNTQAVRSLFTHTLFFALFLLLYAFLALPYSQAVWEAVPLLELTEFPWRMLGPAIFCASVLSAAGLFVITQWLPTTQSRRLSHQTRTFLILNSSLLIVIILNAHYLYPSQFIPWGTPTPADAFAYEAASGAIGTTSTGEFLPRWVRQHPKPETLWPDYEAGRPPQKLDPATLPDGAAVETISHLAESDSLRIDTPEPFVATLRTLYWPGWQLYLNDRAIPFAITKPTGLIQTTIPAGQHRLTLQLEPTPLRSFGAWLTIVAATVILLTGLYALARRIRPRSPIRNTQYAIRTTPTPKLFFLTTTVLLATYLLSRPLAPLFTLQSDPNAPRPADRHLQVDFADQIRLVGLDALPAAIELPSEGKADLTAVLYWRALQPTNANYSVFLHLDGPNGQTFATVDEVNPEDIPTRNWPSGLYLRNPLHLRLPADLPPIRYSLTTGLYNRDTGERLPIAGSNATAVELGSIWLNSPQPEPGDLPPLATFGSQITLHQAALDPNNNAVTLIWKTDQPLPENYSIFVHVLDAAGQLLAQADGVPYDGLYPLSNWQPGQYIEDYRPFDASVPPAALAVGIYDPATGERLAAVDRRGNSLPHNAFTISLTAGQAAEQ